MITKKSLADASADLRNAHEEQEQEQEQEHDKWFRAQAEQAIVDADAPNAEWVPNEDANATWAKKRAELFKRS